MFLLFRFLDLSSFFLLKSEYFFFVACVVQFVLSLLSIFDPSNKQVGWKKNLLAIFEVTLRFRFCYISQPKYVFRLEANMSCVRGQNLLNP